MVPVYDVKAFSPPIFPKLKSSELRKRVDAK